MTLCVLRSLSHGAADMTSQQTPRVALRLETLGVNLLSREGNSQTGPLETETKERSCLQGCNLHVGLRAVRMKQRMGIDDGSLTEVSLENEFFSLFVALRPFTKRRIHKDNLRHLPRFPDFFVSRRILSSLTDGCILSSLSGNRLSKRT